VQTLITDLKQEIQDLEAKAAAHQSALDTAQLLRRQHEEALRIALDAQAESTQRLKDASEASINTHSEHCFLQTSIQRLTLKKQEIQQKIASAYAVNESLGRDVSRLSSEKQEVESNLSALEQILDSAFKVPKPPKHCALMSQALEPMEDGCASCHGPLFGKLCKCAGCGVQMHWHCATGGSYCHSCIG